MGTNDNMHVAILQRNLLQWKRKVRTLRKTTLARKFMDNTDEENGNGIKPYLENFGKQGNRKKRT
jgi:hypothetical protein